MKQIHPTLRGLLLKWVERSERLLNCNNLNLIATKLDISRLIYLDWERNYKGNEKKPSLFNSVTHSVFCNTQQNTGKEEIRSALL